MIANGLRERIVVNFLHYNKELSIDRAKLLFEENLDSINTFFDLIGDDVMIGLLSNMEGSLIYV